MKQFLGNVIVEITLQFMKEAELDSTKTDNSRVGLCKKKKNPPKKKDTNLSLKTFYKLKKICEEQLRCLRLSHICIQPHFQVCGLYVKTTTDNNKSQSSIVHISKQKAIILNMFVAHALNMFCYDLEKATLILILTD